LEFRDEIGAGPNPFAPDELLDSLSHTMKHKVSLQNRVSDVTVVTLQCASFPVWLWLSFLPA